jgi:hypothetical protein
MSSAAFVILARDGGDWLVAHGPQRQSVPTSPVPADQASSVAAALRELGYAGQGVLLAIPSAWCMAASFDEQPTRKDRRTALLYQFEACLPLPAEEIVADFISHGGRCLGVGVQVRTVKPLIEALESAGVSIQSIVPAALVAIDELGHDRGWTEPLVLLEHEGGVDLLELSGGAVTGWSLLPRDAKSIALTVSMAASRLPGGEARRVRAVAGEELLGSLRQAGLEMEADSSASLADAVGVAAQALLQGRRLPPVELRLGALGVPDPLRPVRRPLNAGLAAAALLLLSLTAGLLVRAIRDADLAEQYDQDQRQLYAQAFPGSAVPSSVLSRLRAVWREMAPSAGAALTDAPQLSALRTLHDALAGLPQDVDYQLEIVDVGEDGFTLSGRVPAYEQADLLAAAIRTSSGYHVSPPAIRREADGAAFTIVGERAGASPRALAAAQEEAR